MCIVIISGGAHLKLFVCVLDIPLNDLVANPQISLPKIDNTLLYYIVCRLGNDSQIAANAIRGAGCDTGVVDVIGGLRAWARDVDVTFPVY